jgi:hypothetical protein
VPDAPTADPQVAAEQMRAATDRLRDQAWKVVQPVSAEAIAAPSATG